MVFHYVLTMLVHSQQSSSVRATTLFWILTEFPQVRVRTPPFNLLNSLESIQGSSHTTCQLRISLARPVAKCSPGHSLRTCWCEIPLEILFEIPFDPTDLSPRPEVHEELVKLALAQSVLWLGWDLVDIMESLSFIRSKAMSQILLHV